MSEHRRHSEKICDVKKAGLPKAKAEAAQVADGGDVGVAGHASSVTVASDTGHSHAPLFCEQVRDGRTA